MKNKKIKFILASIVIMLAITMLPSMVFAQAFEPLNSAAKSFTPWQNDNVGQETLTFTAEKDLQPAETTSELENITNSLKPNFTVGWNKDFIKKGDKVYIGTYDGAPLKWNVLNPQGPNITTAQGKGYEETLTVRDDNNIEKSKSSAAFLIMDRPLQEFTMPFDAASIFTSTQKYAASSIKDIVDELSIGIFDKKESNAILRTTKTDEPYTPTGSNTTFANNDGTSMSNIVLHEKLFLISACEFDAYTAGIYNEDYWLRSPYQKLDKRAVYAINDNKTTDLVSKSHSLRPALNLDTKQVAFMSDGINGKPWRVNEALSEVSYGFDQEYKLTISDPNRRNFNVKNATRLDENRVSFNYINALIGDNEYISAVILPLETNNVIYYGKLAKSTGTGTATLEIPSELKRRGGKYQLGIFNEQCNDNNCTDYNSAFYTFIIAT
jgi:hypothetical protein